MAGNEEEPSDATIDVPVGNLDRGRLEHDRCGVVRYDEHAGRGLVRHRESGAVGPGRRRRRGRRGVGRWRRSGIRRRRFGGGRRLCRVRCQRPFLHPRRWRRHGVLRLPWIHVRWSDGSRHERREPDRVLRRVREYPVLPIRGARPRRRDLRRHEPSHVRVAEAEDRHARLDGGERQHRRQLRLLQQHRGWSRIHDWQGRVLHRHRRLRCRRRLLQRAKAGRRPPRSTGGHRDASSKAIDGLIYYNDLYISTGQNQGATTLIDSLGSFSADVATAAAETDGIFNGCQDSMADAFYLSAAAQHVDTNAACRGRSRSASCTTRSSISATTTTPTERPER